MKLFKKKEAAIELSLKNLVILILSFVVLLGLFSMGYKIWKIFTGIDIDEATMNNFNNLKSAIDELIEKDDDEAFIVMPYYIQGTPGATNFGLLGFAGGDGYYQKDIIGPTGLEEGCGVSSWIEKDFSRCRADQACLCLWGLKLGRAIDCYIDDQIDGYYVDKRYSFDKDEHFLFFPSSTYKGFDIKGTDYKTLVILGTCNTFGWQVKSLLIRKEGKNIIFVDPKKIPNLDSSEALHLEGENIIEDVEVFGENKDK